MSEAPVAEGQEPKKKSSMMGMLVMLAIAVLIPLCAGLGVFVLVIQPMLAPAEGEAEHQEEADAHAEEGHGAEAFPHGGKILNFADLKCNVLTEADDPPALVLFSIVLICNEETALLFTEKKEFMDLLTAEITEKMRGRTKAELDNPQVQESILKQIQQTTNQLVKQIEPEKELEVFSAKFKELVIAET